jgi:hypothetical protein
MRTKELWDEEASSDGVVFRKLKWNGEGNLCACAPVQQPCIANPQVSKRIAFAVLVDWDFFCCSHVKLEHLPRRRGRGQRAVDRVGPFCQDVPDTHVDRLTRSHRRGRTSRGR